MSTNGDTTTDDTLPAAFLIGTTKSIKNSNQVIGVSNELYYDLTKNLTLPQNYLKYKFGESVYITQERTIV